MVTFAAVSIDTFFPNSSVASLVATFAAVSIDTFFPNSSVASLVASLTATLLKVDCTAASNPSCAAFSQNDCDSFTHESSFANASVAFFASRTSHANLRRNGLPCLAPSL